MSDKRYKLLLFTASLVCVIVAAIWKYPDVVKANSYKENRLDKYIYVDEFSIIHTSRRCTRLNYKEMTSQRIKVDEMYFYFRDTPIEGITFCPKCVSDNDYETVIDKLSEQIIDTADELTKHKLQ